MANGYLGKISAVVSANTADFDAKLNRSAKEVQSFASRVQGNLTSASRAAAKSLEGIYTPLQRFERSLQAAATMKLSFKGFPGMIRDVDTLQQRLNSVLSKRQLDIVLKTTGMRDITSVREAIFGLKSKDVEVIARVGGLDKLNQLREQIRSDATVIEVRANVERAKASVAEIGKQIAEAQEAGGEIAVGVDIAALQASLKTAEAEVEKTERKLAKTTKAKFGVDADLATLDAVAEKAEKAGDILGKLPLLMSKLGQSDFTAAADKMRQMMSVTEGITKPLESAATALGGLSKEMQAAYKPAAESAQKSTEQLTAMIDRLGGSTDSLAGKSLDKYFEAVRSKADRTSASVERLRQVEDSIGQTKTGREFVFEQPRLSEAITRGAEIGNRAAGLPASDLAVNPAIARSLAEIRRLTDEAGVAYARFLSQRDQGFSTSEAQADIDAVVAKLVQAQAVAENEIKFTIDTAEADKRLADLASKLAKMRDGNAFLITGRAQNMEQAESRESQLRSQIGELDRSQRQNYRQLLDDASVARSSGMLDEYLDLLDQIEFKLAKDKRFNFDTAAAKKKADDFKATIDSLKDSADFQFTGLPQTQSQATSELQRIIGRTSGLDAAALSRVSAAKDAAIAGLGNADFGAPLIKAFGDLVEKEVQAKKAADDLKTAMENIGDAANPSAPIDILKKNLAEAKAAVAKLEGPMKAIGERNIAKIEAFVGKNAGNEAAAVLAGRKAGQLRDDANANAPPKSAKTQADPLGADFGTADRRINALRSNVLSLQNSLERLSTPLQAQFIPAINALRTEFAKLTLSSTQAEFDAVLRKAEDLEDAITRTQQAAKLGGTLGDALNSAALTRTEKQLGFIRAKLLDVGASASGPVAAAFNRYSSFVSDAAKKGTIGLAATKEQADQLAEKIAEAAVAAGLLTKAEGKAFTKGIGDVGRAGADKFALAMNQAAFAVDDFLASTGGLEFKLRAISNNITQLAFILGGTTGLWVGLSAVIAGQAAVGLIKWANNGRTAEDQTKAMNDALARQKSLVEELAEAFRSLGDAMSRGTFSAGGELASEFSRQIEDIKKKQAESRRERVSNLDVDVQRERAEQNKLRKSLESDTDIGSRTAIQSQIRASQDRERKASEFAEVNRPSSADVIRGIERARSIVEFDRRRRGDADPGQFSPEQIERRRREAVAGIDAAAPRDNAANITAQRRALERQIAELTEDATGFGPEAKRAARERNSLESLLASIELPLREAIDELAVSVIEASRGPAAQIRQAQEEVAEAVKAGLPGARLFQLELDNNAKELQAATKKLSQVQSGKDDFGNDLSVEEGERLARQAQTQIAGLEARRRDIAARTNALAYERIVDPQRQIDARMGRARENLSAAGLEDGRIARRMREIEAEREQIRAASAIPGNDNAAFQQAAAAREAALNNEAAALDAATMAIRIFAAALDKASEEVGGNLAAAQQAADEARRADLAGSTPQTQEARRQAEEDLERQRAIARQSQAEIAVERDRLELANQPDQRRLAEINELLKSGGGRDREALIREREAIRGRLEDRARESQARTSEFRDASTREEELRRSAARGRELARTPEERFAEETERGVADIRAAFPKDGMEDIFGDAPGLRAALNNFLEGRLKEARTATAAGRGRELAMTERDRFRRDMEEGVVAELTAAAGKSLDPAALLRQGIANQMESVAPMLQQFAEERQNALLQGPSRAALNVADVSTSQGASELTRLLRGDDSAKDVNLAELRKQTQKFDELIDAIKEANPGVLL